MKQIKNVFDFTFLNQLRAKGFKSLTIVIALLFLILPVTIMPLVEFITSKDASDSDASGDETLETTSEVTEVFAFSDGTPDSLDFSVLETIKLPGYEGASFRTVENYEKAAELGAKNSKSLILGIVLKDSVYDIQGILPENSGLTEDDAKLLSRIAWTNFSSIRANAIGLTEEQLIALSSSVAVDTGEKTENPDEPQKSDEELARESVREVLSFVLLYVNIMLIYFLVLFYGMSAANSVVMEKSSKLMDTMLVSVTTDSLIWGKLLATFAAAIMQFLIWVVSAVLGFAIGTKIVYAMNPNTTMGLAIALNATGDLPPLFGFWQLVLAVLIVLSGFMMYCALAAVCGSLASKEEELSSSMSLFSMVLIISFFAVFYFSGFLNGEVAAGMKWYDIVPFTSIMVTPARLMLDKITPLQGLITFAVVLAFTAVVVRLAGRVYKMMSMYKGNVPKIGQVLKMLKNDK